MSTFLRFSHPRYWLIWAGYLILQVIVRLPHRLRLAVGARLGDLAFHVASRRRRIVEDNIDLCFPELDARERSSLVRESFRSGGISIIETAIAWLIGRAVEDRATLEGIEHLRAAEAKGKGVILLGTHMNTLDLAGTVLSQEVTLDVMYKANRNPLLEHIMTSGRARLYPTPIERRDIRQVIRNVKAGHIVWYGPDQDYGAKNAVFAPFFGVQAATTTALSRIARITGAPVVPFSHFRLDGGQHYRVVLFKALDDFPSGSDEQDACAINDFVESCVRAHPDQYWWFHRRFKTRPPGEPGLYR